MNPCSSLMLWYKWKLHFNQRRQDVRNNMFLNVTWVHCSFIVREHIKRVAFVLQTFPFSDYRNKHFWVSQLWLLTKITHLNTDTSLRHKMPCFIMSIYYLYTWSKSINVGQDEQVRLEVNILAQLLRCQFPREWRKCPFLSKSMCNKCFT